MKPTILFAVFAVLFLSCATAPVQTTPPEEDFYPYPAEKVFANLKTSLGDLGFNPTSVDEQTMVITIEIEQLKDHQRETFMSCFESASAASRYLIPDAKCECTVSVSGSPSGSKVVVQAQFRGRKVAMETGANLGWFRCESTRRMEKSILRQLWKAFGGKKT